VKVVDRRDFIRIVITGSLASMACPRPGGLRTGAGPGAPGAGDSAEGASAGARPASAVQADHYAICHAVRDGTEFRMPAPTRHLPIVIVGAGGAGLFAARELGDLDYLMLEREPMVGGNATGGNWRGVPYSAGTSYNNNADLLAIAREVGVAMRPIDSVDGAVVQDTFIPEFLTKGLDRAPWPQAAKDGFRRYLETYGTYDVEKDAERLDNIPLDEILKDYPPQVREFIDAFGPNSWGGRVADTSAYVGIEAAQWMGGIEPHRYTGDEGFGGLTRALGERVAARGAGRLVTGAAVVRVEEKDGKVLVAYAPPGAPEDLTRLECVSADTVIMAAPKLIARRLVAGLPDDQKKAMESIRYIPYIVANLCFDGVVHESCFDTNILGSPVMSDVVCADFPRLRGQGARDRPTVLTCYMPLTEDDRVLMLDDEEVKKRAFAALDGIDRWFPGAAAKCREIAIRLRGHPMHLSTCGMITRIGPAARRSLGAIHFAGTDGIGNVSDLATALESGRAAAKLARASIDAAARRRG